MSEHLMKQVIRRMCLSLTTTISSRWISISSTFSLAPVTPTPHTTPTGQTEHVAYQAVLNSATQAMNSREELSWEQPGSLSSVRSHTVHMCYYSLLSIDSPRWGLSVTMHAVQVQVSDYAVIGKFQFRSCLLTWILDFRWGRAYALWYRSWTMKEYIRLPSECVQCEPPLQQEEEVDN